MESLCLIFFTYLVGFTSIVVSNAVDTLAPSQFLTINDTLVSSGKSFELGFFSPKTSYVWYLGIWYKDFPDIVVWVANRENPLVDSFGAFSISINGNLTLLNRKNDSIWFSDSSSVAENPVAQLLDSRNFVVRDKDAKNTGEYVWQSFDFPSDTQLAGMKLGWNLEAGVNRFLTSWRNASDPSPGEFTYRIDNFGLPQTVLRNGSEKTFRSGPWNGIGLSGVHISSSPILRPVFIFNSSELYYMYEATDNSVITRFRLDEMGLPQRLVLNKGSSDWSVMYTVKNDQCDDYGQCGANGVCGISQSPVCQCSKGFIPKSSEECG